MELPRPLAVGIDLGGTQLRAGLIEGGAVLRRAAVPTDVAGGPTAVLRQMRELIARVRAPEDRARIAGVGISSPGPLDSERGVVLRIPTLPGWEGFPLRDALSAELQVPVVVENDGIAAAFGEWKHGAGQGLRHLVYVTVSTGLGGGVVLDGRLLHGRWGMAGHVGHFRMVAEGPRCSCGAIGCFESLAAGPALGARARAAAKSYPGCALGRLPPWLEITPRHVLDGAREKDTVCLDLLREEAAYLGAGFTSLIHLFSPELVIMGGGVSNAFDLLIEGIEAVIRREALEPFRSVPVVRAGLGENSGLVGAAALAVARTLGSEA